jgi:4-nitrophenyl phosphatase
VQALILDMDGVLWHDDQPLGDLPKIFAELKRRGYRVALATNNATRSVEQYLDKLARFGVILERWQVINSPQAVAQYLCHRHPQGGPVYVVGEQGLIETLVEYGFHIADQDVLAVIVALDRQVTYEKLKKAALLIRAGAPFIATNPDRTLPTPEGLIPGAGAIVAAVEAATGVKPIIIGKPAPEMYQVALERLDIAASQALVVGDRLETDIAGAQALGCRTALVLSGVTTEEDALRWRPAPDLIAADLTAVVESLPFYRPSDS